MKFIVHITQSNFFSFLIYIDCINCPVATFELYTAKLSTECEYLWQRPRSGQVNYIDTTWYEGRRAGHNTLEKFMNILSEEANLISRVYKNHSIGNTCISRLDENGFEACHITALTSHKSESTIREYSVKCPENKRKEMFNALSSPMKENQKLQQLYPKIIQNSQLSLLTTTPLKDKHRLLTYKYRQHCCDIG